jgi:uncharacterized protein
MLSLRLMRFNIVIAALFMMLGGSVRAQDGRVVQPHITVTGTGTYKIRPNMATISIGVVTEHRSSQMAVGENARVSQLVQAAVQKAGAVASDIQTSNYSIEPQYTDGKTGRGPSISGYQVTNTVSAKVRDVALIGNVVDAATEAGANSINGITFGLQDPESAQEESLDRAMADAHRKALRLAASAGVVISGIIAIEEGQSTRPLPIYHTFAAAGARMQATPIQPGEISAETTVTVVYGIRPGQQGASARRKGSQVASTKETQLGVHIRSSSSYIGIGRRLLNHQGSGELGAGRGASARQVPQDEGARTNLPDTRG